MKNSRALGFTLIELSIVLVIIGLIIGGVLVGQDLVAAAQTRAQVTQIEKYNTAVNTFKLKYGYLPGDIPDPYASSFGFQARGPLTGEGDGNGLLQGFDSATQGAYGLYEGAGETAVFWTDLSTARMIDGSFTVASATTTPGATFYDMGDYFPAAKLGVGNYVYVYSVSSTNYFGVNNLWGIEEGGCDDCLGSNPAVTVAQAYNIDKKIDDGLPQSGRVTASYNAYNTLTWAGVSPGTAVAGSSSTCYDNGNIATATMQYSMEISKGANPNCALSFQMQGAAR